jgi:hypothetical protein
VIATQEWDKEGFVSLNSFDINLLTRVCKLDRFINVNSCYFSVVKRSSLEK